MSGERQLFAEAIAAVTSRTPLITRGVINASRPSRPRGWRRNELDIAISQTRALLDELMLQRTKLRWGDREGDAA